MSTLITRDGRPRHFARPDTTKHVTCKVRVACDGAELPPERQNGISCEACVVVMNARPPKPKLKGNPWRRWRPKNGR